VENADFTETLKKRLKIAGAKTSGIPKNQEKNPIYSRKKKHTQPAENRLGM